MQNPETATLAILSTGHLRKETADLLDNTHPTKWPCAGGSYAEIGWFVYAHDDNAGVGVQRIPDDLCGVMIWARKMNVSYILFDRDAGQIDGLPFYDW